MSNKLFTKYLIETIYIILVTGYNYQSAHHDKISNPGQIFMIICLQNDHC